MNSKSAELLSQLELAYSCEDGLRLILSNSLDLTDELADTLSARAGEFKAVGEIELRENHSAWAAETRAFVTRRLGMSAKSEEAGDEFLRNQRGRFDEAFFDLCYRIAEESRMEANSYIEAATEVKSIADKVDEALDGADKEANIMAGLALIASDERNQAKATLLQGTLLLHRSRWEDLQGRKLAADKAAVEASKALHFAATSLVLPAEFRALAEMRLAALAGQSDLDSVAQHQEAALSIALAGEAWDLVRIIRRDRAYWAKERHDWQMAWQFYRDNIELSEREFFLARVPGEAVDVQIKTCEDYEGAVGACLELAKSDPIFYERALESVEQGKARAFLRGLAMVETALGNVPPKLEARRKRILLRMSTLPGSAKEEAGLLGRALKTVEGQIWRHSPVLAMDLHCVPCNYEQMRALMPPGGVILSYFTFQDRLLIFVLDENGLVGPPTEVKIAYDMLVRWTVELEVVIRGRGDYELTDAVQQKMDMMIPAFNAPLYLRKFHEVLVQPVAPLIAGKRLVIVVPHRILSRLPFQALIDADDRALIDDFAIAYSAGLSVLRWCRAQERTKLETCFAAGVCEFAGGPKSAEEEAAAVARIFGCNPSPATRDAVLLEAGNCDVIHLSCHSDTSSAATAFAGLQLEDGLLVQRKIAGIQCHSSLVTMSACTTARSDLLGQPGTEFAGMMGAFFRAGCPSVIGSLWPAADAVAVPFAEAFYTALKHDGMSKADALRQAQLTIKARSEEGFDHPYFWAPFGLWGNP